jgi:hypothetical protein
VTYYKLYFLLLSQHPRRCYAISIFQTGECRKLYNDELHDVHSSTDIIMQMKSGECGGRGMWHAWERRENMYKFLVGTPEGKRPLGRPRCRWKNRSKMDLREIVWGGVDSVG